MNRVRKSIIVLGVLLFIFIGSTLSIKSISADDFQEENEFFILKALYGDFDQDSCEDDIKIIVQFQTDYQGKIYSILNLDIKLPSGNSFSFTFQISFYASGSPIIITFTSFNTAIESGWYVAKVTGILLMGGYFCYLTTCATFDPPTGEEEGEPGAIVVITEGN